MICKGKAESPVSKWKIDTTGSPALPAASVRVWEIAGAGEGVEGGGDRGWKMYGAGGKELKGAGNDGGVSFFISFL